ncbi:ABC transporter permease [Corynebacterium breve]|uniref:ABC transporter permease n=1 Tax=Corynebacterium breve TaxID=3049799 RepID=A0ABY8VF27_9CORY|nr:ABC transporter permease [Corynebacterium breve]WIM68113.1 ABC transporter permease [Corynebacterium breve]
MQRRTMQPRRTLNNRLAFVVFATLAVLWVLFIFAAASWYPESSVRPTPGQKNELPSLVFPLGTDWLGRDMMARTFKGLNLSLRVAAVTALLSVAVSLALGVIAASGPRWADRLVRWFTDMNLGVPHIVASLLISFAVGGGALGIVLGVGLTQWAPLARLIRAEILKIRVEPYVLMSRAQGRSTGWIVGKHLLPAIWAHVIVGFVYLVPHSVLHESGLTFLGFGFDPNVPSLGIILSEGLHYLSNDQWWAIAGPIALLLILVLLLEASSQLLRGLMAPKTRHQ